MKKTLPRLSEYVPMLRNNKDLDNIRKFWACESYTKFITQQLNISHLVPAVMKDGVWVVLEEPICPVDTNGCNGKIGNKTCKKVVKEYQTALDNVVFKGDYKIDYDNGYWITLKSYTKLFLKDFTIEDIIPYNLEITDTIAEKFKL